MLHRAQRRTRWSLLLGCVAALSLPGCASPVPHYSGSTVSEAPAEPGISPREMQAVADELKRQLSCSESDALLDDLAFWDAMQGYDCFTPTGATFIRVYAHPASVLQTLDEWRETFTSERTSVRGTYWYVIGRPSDVVRVSAPDSDPAIPDPLPRPSGLSAKQDYLSTCVRFVASEGTRYVRQPKSKNASEKEYETLFPGVGTALHDAIDDLGRARIRAIPDHDRWLAALSPIGPQMKALCAKAHDEVQNTVTPLEGS